jgi:ADP-heptose:LPS heptosyltransferase
MNVLIIQQKMIGDVLISTLICENIKKWNPSSKIDFIANTHTVPILQNNPNINKIIIFEDYFKHDKVY